METIVKVLFVLSVVTALLAFNYKKLNKKVVDINEITSEPVEEDIYKNFISDKALFWIKVGSIIGIAVFGFLIFII